MRWTLSPLVEELDPLLMACESPLKLVHPIMEQVDCPHQLREVGRALPFDPLADRLGQRSYNHRNPEHHSDQQEDLDEDHATRRPRWSVRYWLQ